jgi:hypothetical protein
VLRNNVTLSCQQYAGIFKSEHTKFSRRCKEGIDMSSEVANLRNSIETELAAMHRGLNGLAAGVAKHQFIESKMKQLGGLEDQLAQHVGGEQALLFSCQTYLRVMEAKETVMPSKIMSRQKE